MERSAFALGFSLLIIIATLVVFHGPGKQPREDLGMETPRGIPPSQKPLIEKPRVDTTQNAPDVVAATEGIQAEPSEWVIVDVKARILHDGQPLAGALMVAQHIAIRPDTGMRDSLNLFDFESMGHDRQSDQDGNISLKVRYPADIAGDALFGVASFHRDRGTAYDEISVDELSAGRTLELEPELGAILIGKVIGENGEPVPNARVHITTQTPHDAVCLSGLGARSGPDGSFRIPGFRFGNELMSVWANSHHEEYSPDRRTLIQEYGSTERVVDREADFNQDKNAWQLGEISLALTKIAVDLATGEVAPLPSDE